MPLPTRKTRIDAALNEDPFAGETPQTPKPSAKAAPQRAAAFMPAGDTLYLKDIEGQEVLLHNITPGEDSYGPCVDLLVEVPGGDEEGYLVHVSGFLAGRLIGLRERIEAGECRYPLLAQFDKVAIGNGKTVWQMT